MKKEPMQGRQKEESLKERTPRRNWGGLGHHLLRAIRRVCAFMYGQTKKAALARAHSRKPGRKGNQKDVPRRNQMDLYGSVRAKIA